MRPRQHLVQFAKKYPLAWKCIDELRASKNWPDWCFVPLRKFAVALWPKVNVKSTEQFAKDAPILGALAAWRVTQGVYRFDMDLFNELVDTPLTGNIPYHVLYNLPEWCVYIETPGLNWGQVNLYGFFAHLEYDEDSEYPELRLVADVEDDLLPIPIHIGPYSLLECLNHTLDVTLERLPKQEDHQKIIDEAKADIENIKKTLEPFISLLIYLCSLNADIGNSTDKPRKPSPKKIKGGERIFPAEKTRVWDVGVRIGAALRRQVRNSTSDVSTADVSGGRVVTARSSPRPHIRRAHWHGYWTGPKNDPDKRKFILHWMPPVLVNTVANELPVTIRPVK